MSVGQPGPKCAIAYVRYRNDQGRVVENEPYFISLDPPAKKAIPKDTWGINLDILEAKFSSDPYPS